MENKLYISTQQFSFEIERPWSRRSTGSRMFNGMSTDPIRHTMIVRGSRRIWRAEARTTPNERLLRDTLVLHREVRCSSRDQRPHQSVQRVDGKTAWADQRLCRPTLEPVQSGISAPHQPSSVRPYGRSWSRSSSWLEASGARRGWQLICCWTWGCPGPAERPSSTRTEACEGDRNETRIGDCCSDRSDSWRRRGLTWVTIPLWTIDALFATDAGGRSKLDIVCSPDDPWRAPSPGELQDCSRRSSTAGCC